METIIAGLTAWIIAKTGWTVQAPPKIVFVPQNQIVEMMYGPGEVTKHIHVEALYALKDKTIYLPQDWSANKLSSRGALLHELIHHLQITNNVKVRCVHAHERQAYDLHIAWLRENGIKNPYKFLKVDEFTIRLMSACE